MLSEEKALPPQEADETLSRDLLLRYVAARAANLRLVARLRTVSPDEPPPGGDDVLKAQPPAHDVRFPP
jgi:hypothetical protein